MLRTCGGGGGQSRRQQGGRGRGAPRSRTALRRARRDRAGCSDTPRQCAPAAGACARASHAAWAPGRPPPKARAAYRADRARELARLQPLLHHLSGHAREACGGARGDAGQDGAPERLGVSGLLVHLAFPRRAEGVHGVAEGAGGAQTAFASTAMAPRQLSAHAACRAAATIIPQAAAARPRNPPAPLAGAQA
jgi:hypothetical protein